MTTPPRQVRIAAVILAAGSSIRAGATKQLLPLDGKPLLQHAIDNARQSAAHTVVLVLGHDSGQILEAIDAEGVDVVLNAQYAAGQSTSLGTGIEALSSRIDAAIVLLGDQPGVVPAIIDAVIDAYVETIRPIVVPLYNGRRGNPVLFDRSMFAALQAIRGDVGARVILERHAAEVASVQFPFPAPPDIDTLADYHAMREGQAR